MLITVMNLSSVNFNVLLSILALTVTEDSTLSTSIPSPAFIKPTPLPPPDFIKLRVAFADNDLVSDAASGSDKLESSIVDIDIDCFPSDFPDIITFPSEVSISVN